MYRRAYTAFKIKGKGIGKMEKNEMTKTEAERIVANFEAKIPQHGVCLSCGETYNDCRCGDYVDGATAPASEITGEVRRAYAALRRIDRESPEFARQYEDFFGERP